uniref:Uncharacterized protein n=1 Tax=Anguilla anguilla TaxID=7936 RepID=A0A0E9RJF3_ANGAN
MVVGRFVFTEKQSGLILVVPVPQQYSEELPFAKAKNNIVNFGQLTCP